MLSDFLLLIDILFGEIKSQVRFLFCYILSKKNAWKAPTNWDITSGQNGIEFTNKLKVFYCLKNK